MPPRPTLAWLHALSPHVRRSRSTPTPDSRPAPFAGVRARPRTAIAALLLALLAAPSLTYAASARNIPPPAAGIDAAPADAPDGLRTIVLAGGCFWGVQAVYQHTRGVTQAVAGYAGGTAASANYDAVSSGATRHAEAVEVTYDPKVVPLAKLLHIFFSVAHNPTHVNRQENDVGPQYRSAIFIANERDKKFAQTYIDQLNAAKAFPRSIATRLEPLTAFYRAEDYHQDYATLHPDEPYIRFLDLPKIENLRKMFAADFRETPVLVGDAKTN